MKKRYLIIVLTIFASNFSHAHNFYAGVNLGGGFSNIKLNSDNLQRLDSQTCTHITENSFVGDLKIGLQHLFSNNIHIGLEGLFGIANLEACHEAGLPIAADGNAKVSAKMRYTFGVNSQLGYKIRELLAYLILGYAYTSWKTSAETTVSPAVGVRRSDTSSSGLSGFVLGFGVSGMIMDCISLGLEYTHTWYQSRKHTLNDIFSIGSPGENYFVSLQPCVHKIYLTLNYHFSQDSKLLG